MTSEEERSEVPDLDDVLYAFFVACPLPTRVETRRWQERHPAYAEAIGRRAAIMADIAFGQMTNATVEYEDAPDPATDALIARLVKETSTADTRGSVTTTLADLLTAARKRIPEVAQEIDIHRGVLADIVAGRLAPPIGNRLVGALATALTASEVAVRRAAEASFALPTLGHASSDGPPESTSRTYAQSIASSDMTEERKAYWLRQD